MSSINNIEKLIQIATIEQMYLMLEKLKANNTTETINLNTHTNDITNDITNDLSLCLSNDLNISKQINKLKKKINKLNKTLNTSNNVICKLSIRIDELEEELTSIKHKNENDYFDNKHIKGQQKLDTYYGFCNSLTREEKTHTYNNVELNDNVCDYIKEEKYSNEYQNTVIDKDDDVECLEYNKIEPVLIVINEEQEQEQEQEVKYETDTFSNNNVIFENKDVEYDCTEEEFETKSKVKVIVEEKVEETVSEETVSVEEVKEDVEETVSVEEEEVKEEVEENIIVEEEIEETVSVEEEEEEVGTEDESEPSGDNNVTIVIKEKEQDVQEEEEEVFEIEIDDITYFATDEENGILYEMTKDGDVGKKVGMIKDGEPIFN